ncbi:hypothetical protein ABTZ21_33955 [Streptomyces sp. NPDC096191]|uniref:hypothetical protein n=1 Tax=Streptomyces sp. NPDC096191 TaxID=3155426 RepID=UPI003328951D
MPSRSVAVSRGGKRAGRCLLVVETTTVLGYALAGRRVEVAAALDPAESPAASLPYPAGLARVRTVRAGTPD